MMQNLAVPVSECWIKHKQYHMRTERMMMDPKFVKLLAEHTFCLCSGSWGSHRASWGPCAPRGHSALNEQDAYTLLFPSGQGQLTGKKGQDIRDLIKNLQLMWYPVNTRALNLSVHCHHLSQLLTSAARPIQLWQGIDVHPRKHRWMSAQHHQGLELPQAPVCAACQKWNNPVAQAGDSKGKLIQNS